MKIYRMIFAILDQQDRKKFGFLVLFLLIGGALSLLGLGAIIPFITALVAPNGTWLNALFPGQSHESILLIAILTMILAFWLKNIVSYFCLKIQANILYGIGYKTSRKLFKKYMEAPYIWHLNRSMPDLVRNVVNECSVLAASILAPSGAVITELITSSFVLVVLLYVNAEFTLLVVAFLLLFLFIFLRLSRKKASKYANDRSRAWSAMTQDVIQGMNGMKETKIYGLESCFMSSFNQHSNVAASASAFSNIYSQAPRFILEVTMMTVIMIVIACLLLLGQSNHQILILLSVFAVAAMQLLPSLNRMMVAVGAIKYTLPALSLLNKELANKEEEQANEKTPLTNPVSFNSALCFDKVCFSYPDGKVALQDISFTIHPGQAIAFVGHSGSGKTTLADIMLGLFEVKSGSILVDDVCLNKHNLRSWQEHLGYITQSIFLYDTTIKENVAFGVPAHLIDEEKVWKSLEMAFLKEFVQSLPDGLNTRAGENGMKLSGGQRQRIGIARALYRDPAVLIMDEATAALDNQTERSVTQAIQQAIKNRTVITIAHRLSTIKNCDVIFVMDKGQIIANGSYNKLLKTCELFNCLANLGSGEIMPS